MKVHWLGWPSKYDSWVPRSALKHKKKRSIMSCYATLSSHVQKSEFPDNDPSEFKVRLPGDRLWQKDDRWEVGLSGALFPAIPPPTLPPQKVHPENILVHDAYNGIGHPDEWNKNGYQCSYYYTVVNSGKISRNLRGAVSLSEITPSSTAVKILKEVIDKMEQKIAESLKTGDTPFIDVTENSKTTKKKISRDAPLGRGRSAVGQYACVH